MDFEFSDEQTLLGELARGILEKETGLEHQKEIEAESNGFDAKLWSTLAKANLLGTAIPECHGGAGMGLLELCVLLQEVGRAVTSIPVLESLLLGGMTLARFGTQEQRSAWLPALAAGDLNFTAALEDADSVDPTSPATTAVREGDDFVLTGTKRGVPALDLAQRVLVPVVSEGEPRLLLVDPKAAGVEIVLQRTSDRGRVALLRLDRVRVTASDALGGDSQGGREILRWLYEHALVGACALQLGVCERALEITSGYVSEREQFGRPIGTFQAVQHRAADCYIGLEALRWSMWRAAWHLDRGDASAQQTATRLVHVAKFWAAETGMQIASAAQHLHAGLGVDLDYPIHRYFLRARYLELWMGGATPQLVSLGSDMARTGPEESA